jgi:hypothetical protein
MATVTVLKPKDATAAARMRRYRRRQKARCSGLGAVPEPVPTVTVTTIETCAFASRLTDERVTVGDLPLAEVLIMRLVCMLPRDGSITIPAPASPASAGNRLLEERERQAAVIR